LKVSEDVGELYHEIDVVDDAVANVPVYENNVRLEFHKPFWHNFLELTISICKETRAYDTPRHQFSNLLNLLSTHPFGNYQDR
jgi:hypothetical protein